MISPKYFRKDVPHKKIGDLVIFLDHIRKPITASDRVTGSVPYYGANGVQGYVKDFIFDEELVLLAEDGGHFEDADRGIAYKISGKTWVNNHAHVLRPTKNINVDYLFRILQNLDLTSYINGTTRAKLTKANASRIEIPLPPLAEQQRIARILDTADRLMQLRESAIAKLDQLAQSVFVEMLSINKNETSELNLGDVCKFVRGPFGGALKKEIFQKDGYAVYEQQHAIYDQFNNIRYFIDANKFNEMKRFELNTGDLIMSCSGTFGKVAIAPLNIKKGIINQALLKLTPLKSLSSKYLKQYMDSSLFQESLNNEIHGAAIKNVSSVAVLKKLKILYPSLSLQIKIDNATEKIKKQKNMLIDFRNFQLELINSLQHQSFAVN